MKRNLSLLAIVLVITMAMSACGSKSTPNNNTSDKGSSTGTGTAVQTVDLSTLGVDYVKAADPSKSPKVATDRKDTMVIGMAELKGVFNLLFGDSAYDWYCTYLMFDFNVETGFDGKPVPGVTDYTISPNGLTYTFKIKDGVKFWDGKPVTAKDLEFVYYLLDDPNYDGPSDVSLSYIKGLADYKTGTAATIAGIKVVDDKTLEITTDKPNGAAIYSLQIPVLEKAYYAPDFKKGDAAKVKDKNGAPMGTGQYKFVSYKAGQELDLVANDAYYKGAPKIKNVVVSVTPEGKELQRVKVGETDIDMASVSPDNMQAAKDAGFIDVYRFPTNGYGYIGMNDQNPKLSDVKVRQALMYALNRKAVVEKVFGQYAKVVNIPQSSVSWAYNDQGINTYDFDLNKAGQLLDEAGWKLNANGKREKDGQVFTVRFSCMNPHSVTDVMVPVMKDDFATLGIDVTVENYDWPTLYDKATKKQLEMYFMASGLTADPDQSTMWKTGASQNYYNYSNPEVDKLLDQGLSQTNIDDRKATYAQLYKIINNDLPILFVYQRSDMWVANTRIKNLALSSYREFFFDLYKAEIAK